MAQSDDYEFEMFSLRKDTLALVAKEVREGNLTKAKRKGKNEIETRSEGDAQENGKAFVSSFEKGVEMVEAGGDYEIEIADMPSILEEHDAEIDPNTEINGEAAGVIRSHDHSGFGEAETSTYPVVHHESGFRVCTCAAQKYYIVCPHTLARVIERNWADAPVI
ncbi:Zinc finger SWIM-type protein [Halorhabdus tiamatea SARL4B]|uniref:Zinc finger SWIM-type protein n=1 Tax=Halorhabdus tiamatea SARL4B TaxID=1033806 RepID=U2F444_9EURY|nr:hypothetical protein [Halorhabdus tiamatea]ERJ05105.1 Zinc finger SWIM-type protein [Halorhabdus tiamatea SARL4B]